MFPNCNFSINSCGPISQAFRQHHVRDFEQAVEFVRRLPYGRNPEKADPLALFVDGCGTCSTKHAALARLLHEQHQPGFTLVAGMFRMNARNTPKVAAILRAAGLFYLPEAHCYLRHPDYGILDATTPIATGANFEQELLNETVIDPAHIGAPKVVLHRAFLEAWLRSNPAVQLTLDELWAHREDCIAALTQP